MGTNHTRRSSKEKPKIVLEGIENDNVAEVCRWHGSYESQYYDWKRKLLDTADEVFNNGNKKDPITTR